eukprot:gene26172-biopygen14604
MGRSIDRHCPFRGGNLATQVQNSDRIDHLRTPHPGHSVHYETHSRPGLITLARHNPVIAGTMNAYEGIPSSH